MDKLSNLNTNSNWRVFQVLSPGGWSTLSRLLERVIAWAFVARVLARRTRGFSHTHRLGSDVILSPPSTFAGEGPLTSLARRLPKPWRRQVIPNRHRLANSAVSSAATLLGLTDSASIDAFRIHRPKLGWLARRSSIGEIPVTKASGDTKTIEKKFGETAFRLSQERSDFLLPQILDFVASKKWVNLHPEYQRRLVWDDAKRSLFIESLLLNVPVPPVFLYEWELSRYEVMDGQQRLNAIVDFYENGYALKELEKWEELNGMRFRDLPETLRRGLDRRRLSATVLLVEGADKAPPQQSDIRKLVFERLNTGGQHLNAQELRNCLFAGDFNNLLIELSGDPMFTEIWGIPSHDRNIDMHGNVSAVLRENPRYRRMQDCEIVLRFFALRKRANIKGSVRSMLDRCMEEHLNVTSKQLSDLREDFRSRLTLAQNLFGASVFRYKDENGTWLLSQTLYDGVMVAIDRLWAKREHLLSTKARVVARVTHLLRRPSAFEVIIGRPNTAKAVQKRMKLLVKAIEG